MNIMQSNDAHTNLHAIVIGCYMITMRHFQATDVVFRFFVKYYELLCEFIV